MNSELIDELNYTQNDHLFNQLDSKGMLEHKYTDLYKNHFRMLLRSRVTKEVCKVNQPSAIMLDAQLL